MRMGECPINRDMNMVTPFLHKRGLFAALLTWGAVWGAYAQEAVAGPDGEAGISEVADWVSNTATEKNVWRPATPEEIMFGVRIPERSGMSEDVSGLLDNRIVQILGRCGAGASGKRDVFVVEPVVNVLDKTKSEGLVQNVSSVKGELSLTARHRYSDAVIYNTTIPISAVVKGGGSDDAELLTKAIKPTDAAFVRFVRNARKNAFEYGTVHPDIYEIPAEARDTVIMLLPVAVAGGVTESTPDSAATPVAVVVPSAKPGSVDCEIFFSDPGWKGEVVVSEYEKSTRSIHFTLKITNTLNGNRNGIYTSIARALDVNGGKYKSGLISDTTNDFPHDIPVTVDCYIKDVYENPGKVPFIEIALGNQRMEIRNMPVK